MMDEVAVDRSVAMGPRKEANPGLREPPEFDDQTKGYYHGRLKGILQDAEEDGRKSGLAIVAGIVACELSGAAGVKEDMKNMEWVFKKLGLAVWKMRDKDSAEIACAVQAVSRYKFPASYKFIILYFSGHGESRDNHPYIYCYGDKDTPVDTLSIEKGIVAPLLMKNAPQLKSLHRIFLFDCCLKDDAAKGEACRVEDISLPSFDNIVMAYATSMTFTAEGDNKGGLWTKSLAKNIMERDLPLTTVLDLTWEDAVSDFIRRHPHAVRQGKKIPQGPHYASSTGLIWLWHPGRKLEKHEHFLPLWISDAKKGGGIATVGRIATKGAGAVGEIATMGAGAVGGIATMGAGAVGSITVGAGAVVVGTSAKIIRSVFFKKARPKVDTDMLEEYATKLRDLQDWHRLALKLHFSWDKIKKIAAENEGEKEYCIMEVMNRWLEKGPTSTRAALMKALHDIQEHVIAASLQEDSSEPGVPLTTLPDGPLNPSEHLVVILRELQELIDDWQILGIELGLQDSTLQAIEVSRQHNVDLCKADMIAAWLQGKDNAHSQGGITKKALVDALERADFKALAIKLDPVREKSSSSEPGVPLTTLPDDPLTSSGEGPLLRRMSKELEQVVEGNTKKCGLAVIVGMVEPGPAGVLKDMENMYKAFEKLNLVTFKLKDPSSLEIICLIKAISNYQFPDAYRFVIFYFSGFGENRDGHAFIRTADAGSSGLLSIQQKLISPLLPINAPRLIKLRRIFLFDSCVKDDSLRGPVLDTSKETAKDVAIPSYGNVLIAYSTSKTSSDRGNCDEGGVWTRFLSESLERDSPLTTILDLTWEEMFSYLTTTYKDELRRGKKDLPCPHYTSSAGLIWLKHPGCSVEEGQQSFPLRATISTAS